MRRRTFAIGAALVAVVAVAVLVSIRLWGRAPSGSAGVTPLIRAGAPAPTPGPDGPPAIVAEAESELFPRASGDVADDSAIWRNRQAPERSLVIAGDKSPNGGIAVFGLDGKLLHYVRTGKIGNVDVLDDVPLNEVPLNEVPLNGAAALVGANDRTSNTLRFWSLDRSTGVLTNVEARPLRTLAPNYGLCLGRSGDGSKTYAFVTGEDTGLLEQYELSFSSGRVDATKVRSFDVGSQSEGCVVDGVRGALFVAEEDVGIWRYDLDPASGPTRTSVDRVGGGRLAEDVEGITATRGAGGKGVLIASSQGDSTYAVYDLDGNHDYLGSFRVRGGDATDDVRETDGLAAAAGSFGPTYPNGLLVVHDGENADSTGRDDRATNLKFARLDRVVALGVGP